jgi:hypothetical protein
MIFKIHSPEESISNDANHQIMGVDLEKSLIIPDFEMKKRIEYVCLHAGYREQIRRVSVVGW